MKRWYKQPGGNTWVICGDTCNQDNIYYQIATKQCADNNSEKCLYADTVDGSGKRAYAVFTSGTLNKKTGYKMSDWDDLKRDAKYYERNADGTVYGKQIDTKQNDGNFTPSTRDAEDGALVDLSNQARIKGTVTGGAVGGAMGGIAGYSGAKNEVSERWTTAVREYEDSLSNFVCVTGGRYLSKYNSYVEIPTLIENQ